MVVWLMQQLVRLLKDTSGLALETGFFFKKKDLGVQTSCESQTFTVASHECWYIRKKSKKFISHQNVDLELLLCRMGSAQQGACGVQYSQLK